jgi:glycerol-3-phosphate acyltransferase PlsY
MNSLMAVAPSYLLGSINAAGLVAFLFQRDPRSWGSGRLGAWNTGRRMGFPVGLLVFVGDFAKGTAAVILAGHLGADETGRLISALAAVAGHVWPIFFGFRGGKGLATSLGILAVIDPRLAGASLTLAAVTLLCARSIYPAALSGIAIVPFLTILLHPSPPFIVFGFALAALLLYTHRLNIREMFTAVGHERR